MPKNIIVLSDGTGNSSAKLFKTNVWRTYEALDLSNPKKQIACYDDGVGNSSFKPFALLGGAIGIGLSRNVRELYAYICRNYEEGDRIYGFGFSRGAFTIRILAGFIAKMGILRRSAFTDESDLQKKTTQLFRAYRKQASGDGLTPLLALVFRAIRDWVPGQALPQDFKNAENLHLDAKIEFLGLWDTVDAYGFPIDEMTVGWDRFVWPLSMRNRDLSSKVKKAAHALSLDDERNSFHPLLWNETGDSAGTSTKAPVRQHAKSKHIKEEQLSQVWFSGMHADVGGGYPEDFLSYVSLNWVLTQAGPHVIFNTSKREEYAKAARVTGIMHNSRAGLGAYYRLLPRKLEKLADTSRFRFQYRPWKLPKPSADNLVKIDLPKIHHSVFDRIKTKGLGYAPIVLPKKYAVVMPNDSIMDLGAKTLEAGDRAELRARAQEEVWDLVWQRRIAYFATLSATACLVLLPWANLLSSFNWIWPLSELEDGEKCIKSSLCFVAGIPKLLGVFLPAFAFKWVDTYSANPGVFLGLVAAVGGLMGLGTWLDSKIHIRMSALWPPSPILDGEFSTLHDIRESKIYQGILQGLKKHLMPAIFGLAALASLGIIGLSGISRITFSWHDARGEFCISDGNIHLDGISRTYSARRVFDPKVPCWRAGLLAEKGAIYRVVLNIAPDRDAWKDGDLRADLTGILDSHGFFAATTAWPAKRYVWENYYKPIVRIRKVVPGAAGQDEYVLNPTFKSARPRYDCLVSDFVAESSGELYLFVNDAIIYFMPNGLFATYDNNGGKAEFHVKRIASIGEAFALPTDIEDTSACKEFLLTPP